MSPDPEDEPSSPEPEFDEDASNMAETKNERASTEEKSPSQGSNNETKPAAKSNAKDPSRPRRKKARRACFACQRAHLTCGDERPCMRCIKRGLQDQCHDGVRKKAKYLHDAPAEALIPGFANGYQMQQAPHGLPAGPGAQSVGSHAMAVSQPGMFMPANAAPSYPQFTPSSQQGSVAPQMMNASTMSTDFATPSNMETPTQYRSNSSLQVSPAQMTDTMDGQSSFDGAGNVPFDQSQFYDPNDPSLFLDPSVISDLNFGNHYGALEFNILGQMSSGVLGTPDVDVMNPVGQGMSFDQGSTFNPSFAYNQGFQPWNSIPNSGSRSNSMNNNYWGMQSNGMDAFAVGEHTGSLTGASPHSQNQDFGNTGYQSSTASPEQQFVQPEHNPQSVLLRQSISQAQQQQQNRKGVFPNDAAQAGLNKKRRRDTSEIYSAVNAPYPYTQGFHSATAFLQKRFPTKKVLRIARSLSNIRPSFISCQKNLTHEDLIFTEKCFQRSLVEHEDYLNHYGCPTLICRRTLEVAAVSKEFSLLTNWRRDVLLGKEPNLNVNTEDNGSGTQTGTSSRGAITPRIPAAEIDTGRPQPVFLAELLDEDSIVKFYQDYSEIAFGSERDKVLGETCSLMKYKTKDDPGWGSEERAVGRVRQGSTKARQEGLMKGEAGMNALGEKDGRIPCGLCWQVKRDMFDIPMFIILNVSAWLWGWLGTTDHWLTCVAVLAYYMMASTANGVKETLRRASSAAGAGIGMGRKHKDTKAVLALRYQILGKQMRMKEFTPSDGDWVQALIVEM